MKHYVVKITKTFHGENPYRVKGETTTYYMGKGGYVHAKPEWVEPWSRKRFAEECIKKDSEWSKKYESDWESTYEILEW